MTEAQLITLITNTFTTNGTGDITGHVTKDALIEMVTSIYDAIESYVPTPPLVDDKSIELDVNSKLQAKLFDPIYEIPKAFKYAPAIKMAISGTAFDDGLYVKIDGKTIGVNTNHELISLADSGGGGINSTNTFMDDFNKPITAGNFTNVYPSIDSVNGYVKFDTGAGDSEAYFYHDNEVFSSLNPSFEVNAKFGALTTSKVFFGVSSISEWSGSPVGFVFSFDTTSATGFWAVSCCNGDAFFSADTTVLVDALEHSFSAQYNNGIITWYIDGVEVYSKTYVIDDVGARLFIKMEDDAAAQNTMVSDYYFVSQDKIAEASPTFDTVVVSRNAIEKKYRAIVSQTGVTAPTVDTLLINDFSGVPVWTRSSAGVYVITLVDAFKNCKPVTNWDDVNGNHLSLFRNSDDFMTLTILDHATNNPADANLSLELISIDTYHPTVVLP